MRQVDVADAFDWLPRMKGRGPVVAVLPDAAEIGLTVAEWESWFVAAAKACLKASAGPTVFLQTDRRAGGQWYSKPQLINKAAGRLPLLWHKIVLRRSPGSTDLHRPTYSHLLAYGPGKPGSTVPDVFDGGPKLWPNGIGLTAARFVIDFLSRTTTHAVIVNPFCGLGTVLAAAEEIGMDAFGCDLDSDRAALARQVTLNDEAFDFEEHLEELPGQTALPV